MKKIILSILIICFSLTFNITYAQANDLNVYGKNVGLYILEDLRPIYTKNEDIRIQIASITKVMTAIVCVENIQDLNSTIIVDLPQVQKYYNEEYSVAGLRDKQEVTYYDLIATMLIPSGADSAACIAINVFGEYSKFIEAMNNKAKQLGMNNTSFENPIGADHKDNYSTVYDLALMMKHALSNETIKQLMSQYSYTTVDKTITVYNALYVLADIYNVDVSRIAGGKTGMTGDAGYCLASYSSSDEEPLICITMGCEIRRGTLYHLEDSQKMYEYANKNYDVKNIVNKGDNVINLPVIYGIKDSASIILSDDVSIYVKNNQEIDESKIELEYSGLDTLSYKDRINDIVGKVRIYYNGRYIKEVTAIVGEEIQFNIFKWAKNNIDIIVISIIIFGGSIFSIIRIKSKHKILSKK